MKHSRSWLLLCGLHGVTSMLLWWDRSGLAQALTWRADQWQDQLWTLWSSAWVHMNTPHLIGNQLALGALTAFAWMVRPPLGATLAWLLAWPLMQLSLAYWPQVGYAVGLSGVLHAGVAVLAAQLVAGRIPMPQPRRWGTLLALGLLSKLVLEQAWSHPVVWDTGYDMSVVQAAHLTGAAWGALLGTLAALLARRGLPVAFALQARQR